MNQPFPIFVYIAIALAVSRIPLLRIYFSLCNTLIYQVISICLQGGIRNKIKLHKDGSGQTTIPVIPRFKHSLITYAGYTGTSIAAILLFYLVSKQNYHLILYLFIGLMAVSLLLWIRTFFGFIWALSFAAFLILPIYYSHEAAVMHIAIFLPSVIFIQSIVTSLKLCRQIFKDRKNHVRTGILAKAKWIPSMVAGLVLLGQSLIAGFFIVSILS